MYINSKILLGLILCWSTPKVFTQKVSTQSRKPGVFIAEAKIEKSGLEVSVQFVFPEKYRDHATVYIHYFGLAPNQKYNYHIHEHSVRENCDSTGGHWNPTGWRGECDPKRPNRCESGALSTKHGPLVGHGPGPSKTVVFYNDTSLRYSASERGIVYKSLVIHDSTDKLKRIACATIQPQQKKATSTTSGSTTSGSTGGGKK